MRVQPSSSHEEVPGWNEAGELRVRITARPVEGAANKRLVACLAKRLSVPKGEIRIESGERSRVKLLSAPAHTETALVSIPDS